jgi:site-specific DNA-methyltransferase (adenine-specific)
MIAPHRTEPYYQDDYVTLYHGDCLTEHREWLEADILVTDPPYGVAWKAGQFSNAAAPNETTIASDETPAARDAMLTAWGDRPALVFWIMEGRPPSPRSINRLIWYKAANIPGMRTQPWYSADEEIYQIGTGFCGKPVQNVLVTHDRRDGANGEVARIGHPTPKPVGLMERLIEKCPPGTVADPFAGSGSTLVAAKALGRKAIGVELEERYCEIAARRLSQEVLFT